MRSRVLVALTVVVYLAVLRTRHISETFWLLGDQILYWRIALLPWNELPIGGGPSSVGGTTLGPAFVWTMWLVRQVVGPWVDNLPHAGGIGLSLIQSAADGVLLLAIWKRFSSLPLALAVTLLVATSPYDMTFSATIWNPPLAVAFIKLAIAFVLLGDRDGSVWWSVAATAMAILAVQCHSSAVFFAAPVIASLAARDLLARRRDRALAYLAASAVVLLALETPLLLDLASHPGKQTSPPVVVNNILYTLEHPELWRPLAAFHAVSDASAFILLRPWSVTWFGPLMAACAAVTAFRARRDLALAAITVMPPLLAMAGFSFWQLAYDHYWFLTIAPSVGLTLALAATAWRPLAAPAAVCLAIFMIAAQPSRFADSRTLHRLPEYGPLVRGSEEIRRRMAEVRRIDTEFDLPPSTERQFVFEVLGGKVTPTAAFSATIERTGQVRFTPAE